MRSIPPLRSLPPHPPTHLSPRPPPASAGPPPPRPARTGATHWSAGRRCRRRWARTTGARSTAGSRWPGWTRPCRPACRSTGRPGQRGPHWARTDGRKSPGGGGGRGRRRVRNKAGAARGGGTRLLCRGGEGDGGRRRPRGRARARGATPSTPRPRPLPLATQPVDKHPRPTMRGSTTGCGGGLGGRERRDLFVPPPPPPPDAQQRAAPRARERKRPARPARAGGEGADHGCQTRPIKTRVIRPHAWPWCGRQWARRSPTHPVPAGRGTNTKKRKQTGGRNKWKNARARTRRRVTPLHSRSFPALAHLAARPAAVGTHEHERWVGCGWGGVWAGPGVWPSTRVGGRAGAPSERAV